MKNKFVLLTAICLLGLVSCGGDSTSLGTTTNPSIESTTNDSSITSETTSNTTTSETTTGLTTTTIIEDKDWKSSDKELMETHLNGVVIPFIELTSYEISWEKTQNALFIVSTVSDGSKLDENYASILSAEGYEVTKSDSGEVVFYTGVRFLEDGARLSVQVYIQDGSFVLVSWIDTPLKSWPTSEINALFAGYELNISDTIPEFASDAYFLTDFYSSYSCFEIEVPQQTSIKTTEDVYTKTLEDAGWTIDKSQYEDYGIIALAPNKTIQLCYYFTSSYFIIDVYHNVPTVSWPTAEIRAMLGDSITETIPEFVWESGFGFEYIAESDTSFEHIELTISEISGTTDEEKLALTETAYTEVLKADGWIIDLSNYEDYGIEALSPFEQIVVNYYYYGGSFFINIYKGSDLSMWISSTSWPTEEIQEALPDGSTLPPEYAGSAFDYKTVAYDNGKTSGLVVRTIITDLEADKKVYTDLLVSNGFVLDAGGFYLSEKGDIKVTVTSTQPSKVGNKYLLIEVTNVYKIAEGIFDMSISLQRTEASSEKAVYVSGFATMTIEKNKSTNPVGGDGLAFLPDANGISRLYGSQKITINVTDGSYIKSVVFNSNGAKGGANAVTNGTITGGTATSDSTNMVSTIVADANTSTITIILSSQIRVTSIEVTKA